MIAGAVYVAPATIVGTGVGGGVGTGVGAAVVVLAVGVGEALLASLTGWSFPHAATKVTARVAASEASRRGRPRRWGVGDMWGVSEWVLLSKAARSYHTIDSSALM